MRNLLWLIHPFLGFLADEVDQPPRESEAVYAERKALITRFARLVTVNAKETDALIRLLETLEFDDLMLIVDIMLRIKEKNQ